MISDHHGRAPGSVEFAGADGYQFALTVKRLAVWVSLMLAFAWIVVAAAIIGDSSALERYAAAIVPGVTMFVGASVALYLVARERMSLLTPLPLAFSLVALVFGLGPLLYVFQPDSVYGTANFRIPMDASAVFRVQILNLVGLTFLTSGLAAAAAFAQSLIPTTSSEGIGADVTDMSSGEGWQPTDRLLLRGYLCFTAIALVMRSLHRAWNVDVLGSLPGFFHFADGFGTLAVFLGAFLAARRSGSYWLLPVLPLAVEVADGLLALRKSRVLTPIFFGFVGMYLGGRSLKLLTLGVALCLAVFVAVQPVIDQGRRLVWVDGGLTAAEYYAAGLSADVRSEVGALDLWRAWDRWNYTPVQYVLMQEYDADRRGSTFRELPWVFVPRVIMPAKPVLDHGARVTELVFGHRRSSTGATIFGEAYWNGGWPFVMLAGVIAGAVLFVSSLVCLWIFSQPSLIAWAIGFMGILTGQLLQNFFSVGFVGLSVTFFCLAFLLSSLSKAGTPRPTAARLST